MKNKIVPGISLAILGAIISIAPNFLIGQQCINMKMKCFWAARTEVGIGILIIILALLLICFKSREAKLGISLSLALIGAFGALIATVLIGFCNGSCSMKCTCSSASLLVMTLLGMLVVVISLVNFMLLKKNR